MQKRTVVVCDAQEGLHKLRSPAKELQRPNQLLHHGNTLPWTQKEQVLRLYGRWPSSCTLAALKLSSKKCFEGDVDRWHRLTTHLPVGNSLC
jgi:hypothetical protein